MVIIVKKSSQDNLTSQGNITSQENITCEGISCGQGACYNGTCQCETGYANVANVCEETCAQNPCKESINHYVTD